MATWNPFDKDFWGSDNGLYDAGGEVLDFLGMNPGKAKGRAERAARDQENEFTGLDAIIPGMEQIGVGDWDPNDYPDLANAVMSGSMTEEEATAEINRRNTGPREIDLQNINPEELDYLDPAMVSGLLQGYDPTLQEDSEMLGLRNTGGLQGIRNIAEQGGLTAIDRARIAEQRAGEEQWLRGQREAQMANMQARGLGGSGAEMASLFDQQQSSANRNARSGLQTEAMAQQRQDSAWRDLFSGESDIATAQDQVNRGNAMLGTDAARYQADVMNQGAFDDTHAARDAEGYNAGVTNNAVYANNDIDNEETRTNYEEPWRVYGALADNARGRAGVFGEQANYARGQQTSATNDLRAGIGAVAGSMGMPGVSAGLTGSGGGSPYSQGNGYKTPGQLKSIDEDDE